MLDKPFTSIVVPTYNRTHLVELCLDSLFNQSYPTTRYEVIVVDDGSTEDTVERATMLAKQWNGAFRIIQKANGGPASARNAGLKASEAEIIAFIDSDCVAAPDWLEKLISTLVTAEAAGVGGPVLGAEITSLVADYLEASKFYRHRVRNGKVDYLITGNTAFRRMALLDVGGFRTIGAGGSDDVDLSFKLQQAGYKLVTTDTGAVVHHGSPQTVRELWRSLYRYGRGNYIMSSGWRGRRSPLVEFVRHAGAVALSLLLALRLRRRVGLQRALKFWPLVVVEHIAFDYGMLAAWLEQRLPRSLGFKR